MAVSLFSERLFEQVILHADVGIHALQASVLLGHRVRGALGPMALTAHSRC